MDKTRITGKIKIIIDVNTTIEKINSLFELKNNNDIINIEDIKENKTGHIPKCYLTYSYEKENGEWIRKSMEITLEMCEALNKIKEKEGLLKIKV